MDSKVSFMSSLNLKVAPRIVKENKGLISATRFVNMKSIITPKFNRSNSNMITFNNTNNINQSNNGNFIKTQQQNLEDHKINSILTSPNLFSSNNNHSVKNHFNNNSNQNKGIQFIKYNSHTENLSKCGNLNIQKPVSIIQRSTGKTQSLLVKKRNILNTSNTCNSVNNLSNKQLINSLIKNPFSNFDSNEVLDKEQNLQKLDEKHVKFIKLCITKLEFSSPLYRKISSRMSFLFCKSKYESIRTYEKFCSTSNKSVLKQVMSKNHVLKYKPSRSRSRMLRSNEIVDGKLMISWQRGTYVHIYTFNRRQRIRRFRQISINLGLEKKTLQLMYGLKKVILPRILDCPYCKQKLNPDLGHYCVVTRKKCKKIKVEHKKEDKIKDVQTSDYVSNESDTSLETLNNLKYTSVANAKKTEKNKFKIKIVKLNNTKNEESTENDIETINKHKKCPTLLLDSSNFNLKNINNISRVIVHRMKTDETSMKLNKSINQESLKNLDSTACMQVKRVYQASDSNLIQCRIMDQQNFSVSSLDNGIRIVFK